MPELGHMLFEGEDSVRESVCEYAGHNAELLYVPGHHEEVVVCRECGAMWSQDA